jgi:hypothetical protein
MSNAVVLNQGAETHYVLRVSFKPQLSVFGTCNLVVVSLDILQVLTNLHYQNVCRLLKTS